MQLNSREILEKRLKMLLEMSDEYESDDYEQTNITDKIVDVVRLISYLNDSTHPHHFNIEYEVIDDD